MMYPAGTTTSVTSVADNTPNDTEVAIGTSTADYPQVEQHRHQAGTKKKGKESPSGGLGGQ